jgi:hypothetical protein
MPRWLWMRRCCRTDPKAFLNSVSRRIDSLSFVGNANICNRYFGVVSSQGASLTSSRADTGIGFATKSDFSSDLSFKFHIVYVTVEVGHVGFGECPAYEPDRCRVALRGQYTLAEAYELVRARTSRRSPSLTASFRPIASLRALTSYIASNST